MDTDIESLERATLDAVGPADTGALPGWLLPFDSSTVGRAISAVPLRHADMDPALLPEIEARYARRGLKAQFRIANVTGLENLQQGLLSLGFSPQKPTLTLVGSVNQWPGAAMGDDVQLSTQPTEAWTSVYTSEDFDPVDGANRVRALSCGQCLLYASLSDASGAIAAGAASFSQGWVSLHGLRTVARARGQGHASALIAALGRVALTKKAERCFLQVEEGNATAIRLYRSLGFQTAWLYHYWCRSA